MAITEVVERQSATAIPSPERAVSEVAKALPTLGKKRTKKVEEQIVYYLPEGPVSSPKGKVPQQNVLNFMRDVGEPHPEDYTENILIAKRNPIVRAILKKYATHVIGNGFDVRTDDEKLTEEIREYNKQIKMEQILRKAVIGKKVFGWLPMEIIGKDASGLAIRSPTNIYLKTDDYGSIEKVNQYFGNKVQASWEPDQIALFMEEDEEEKIYPSSLIETIRVMSDWKLNSQKSMVKILDRKANPALHFQIGDKDFNPSPTQGDIDAFSTELETLTNTTEWVTAWNTKITAIDTGNFSDKFTEPLKNLTFEIIAAGQVPEVILGGGSIPEGLAKEQREDWNLTIRAEQQALETVLVQQIYAKRFPDKKIDIIWGLPSDATKQEEVTKLSALLAGTIQLTPVVRLAIEKRIAKLLDLEVEDEDIDASADEEKEREDKMMQQKQQNPFGVSGDTKESVEMTQEMANHVHELSRLTPYKLELNERIATKGSVKEAVGWEPHPFNRIIIRYLETEQFADLSYLSHKEKDQLRFILQKAIRQEWSIPTISAEIEKRLKKPLLNQLTNEFIDRRNADPTKEEVAHLQSMIRTRAEVIARSEIIRASNESALKAYEASNIVNEVQWLTAKDEKTCEICAPLNMKKFPLNEAMVPVTDTHPNCRCVILPVLKL